MKARSRLDNRHVRRRSLREEASQPWVIRNLDLLPNGLEAGAQVEIERPRMIHCAGVHPETPNFRVANDGLEG